MIDCLIFSKNRAAQLDLLLRSIQKNFSEINSNNISILFKYTNNEFAQGYDKLIRKFAQYTWITEQNFQTDTRSIVQSFTQPLSVVFVDDEVVVNDFKILSSIKILYDVLAIYGISLQMHDSINFSYSANKSSPPPKSYITFSKYAELIGWNWAEFNQFVEHGYPSRINSTIYRTQFLQRWVSSLKFKNANDLEGQLNLNRATFQPILACFKNPKTILTASNLVQTGFNRFIDSPETKIEFLNDKFLNGYILNLDEFIGMKKNSPCFPHIYSFEKSKK